MSLRIGIISDTHLGSQQFGLERRKKDFYKAFYETLEEIQNKGIRTIIHAGDLLNSNRPDPESIRILQQADKVLTETGTQMFVISGNHDKTTPPWTDVLRNDWSVKSGIKLIDYGHALIFDGEMHSWNIFGLPSMHAETFHSTWRDTSPVNPPDIMVIHQPFAEFTGASNSDTLGAKDMPENVGLIIVGDTHVTKTHWRKVFNGVSQQAIISPGSTELCSESEASSKFWIEVLLEKGHLPVISQHLIKSRPVVRLSLTNMQTAAEDMEKAIASLAVAYPAKEDVKPIVFVNYLADIPKVMQQFRTALDPDDYILRFKPILTAGKISTEGAALEEVTDTVALLKEELATKPELYPIASMLINQEVNPDAALDEFIDGRLRAIAEQTAVPVI